MTENEITGKFEHVSLRGREVTAKCRIILEFDRSMEKYVCSPECMEIDFEVGSDETVRMTFNAVHPVSVDDPTKWGMTLVSRMYGSDDDVLNFRWDAFQHIIGIRGIAISIRNTNPYVDSSDVPSVKCVESLTLKVLSTIKTGALLDVSVPEVILKSVYVKTICEFAKAPIVLTHEEIQEALSEIAVEPTTCRMEYAKRTTPKMVGDYIGTIPDEEMVTLTSLCEHFKKEPKFHSQEYSAIDPIYTAPDPDSNPERGFRQVVRCNICHQEVPASAVDMDEITEITESCKRLVNYAKYMAAYGRINPLVRGKLCELYALLEKFPETYSKIVEEVGHVVVCSLPSIFPDYDDDKDILIDWKSKIPD